MDRIEIDVKTGELKVVNDILRDCGAKTPWRFYADPPSPCELLKWCAANLQHWIKE